jgi:hypothetical protein
VAAARPTCPGNLHLNPAGPSKGPDGRELTAGDDPGVGDEDIRWAIEHASPAAREGR